MNKLTIHYHFVVDATGEEYTWEFKLTTDMEEREIEPWIINGTIRGHETPKQLAQYARSKGFYCKVSNVKKYPRKKEEEDNDRS